MIRTRYDITAASCFMLFALSMILFSQSLLAADTELAFPDTNPKLPYADTDPLADTELPPDTRSFTPERTIEQDVFKPGEFLKMRVTYLGMTAGYIEVRVNRKNVEGRDLYALNMKAYTAGPVEWFYSARDRLISYMDARGLFSWGYDFFKNHQDEKEQTRVRYYHHNGVFTENGKQEGAIPPYTQDLLSAVYYVRTQKLETGQEYDFPVHSSDRSYRLTLKVKESDRVATGDGWREAFVLLPTFEKSTDRDEAFEHVKKVRGVKLWISRDHHKVPLKISLPATFGHVYAYLHDYEPGS